MTQLSNVLNFDHRYYYYQNKLLVIKTSDNCVFSKADLRAMKVERPSKKLSVGSFLVSRIFIWGVFFILFLWWFNIFLKLNVGMLFDSFHFSLFYFETITIFKRRICFVFLDSGSDWLKYLDFFLNNCISYNFLVCS